MNNGSEHSKTSGDERDRRSFFAGISVVCSAAIGLVMTLPAAVFVLAPAFTRSKRVWRRVGKVDDFSMGKTVDVSFEDASPRSWAGTTAETSAWLRRVGEEEFIAFSINCRHLGCPVRWVEGASLFMCPCHGGVYYADGEVAAGPPPSPLARYPVRVRNGFVEIETTAVPLTTNDAV